MVQMVRLLPTLVMVAACSSKPVVHAENASVAQIAATAKGSVQLEPGKWATTVAVLSVDGPGLPPGVATAMKQQAQAHTSEMCLSPEDATRPPQDMLGAAKGCTYETFEMSGGKMSGTLVCKKAPGLSAGNMRATMSGTFAGTHYDVTSEASIDLPGEPGGLNGGRLTTKTHIQGRRLGACDTQSEG
jgi:hypothetical protein